MRSRSGSLTLTYVRNTAGALPSLGQALLQLIALLLLFIGPARHWYRGRPR